MKLVQRITFETTFEVPDNVDYKQLVKNRMAALDDFETELGDNKALRPAGSVGADVTMSVNLKTDVELLTMPALSTAHISYEADSWLGEWGSSCHALVMADGDAGYFVRVLTDHADIELVPQSIREVAAWANNCGHHWFRLDRDAPRVDGLTAYDW